MVGTLPIVGDMLVRVLRGGETLGALTLSRFFAVHILFLPALLMSLVLLHLFILRRVGPAGPWSEERAARGSETFYPRQVYMDAIVMAGVFVTIAVLARFVPFPLADKADPSDTTFVPVPEWYFLFYYQLLKYVHGALEPLATWVLPGIFFLVLLFWPFIDRNPARHPIQRPAALTAGVLFLAAVFTLLGVSLRDLYACRVSIRLWREGKRSSHNLGVPDAIAFMVRAERWGRISPMKAIPDRIASGTSGIFAIHPRCRRVPSCRNFH